MPATHRPRRRLNDDDLSQIIRSELEQADGAASDELDDIRSKAIARYYGLPRGDEVKGRSKVISTDVADMVEAVVADIGPSLTRPGVASFTPVSEADEKDADLETAAVDNAVYQQNDGFRELTTAIKEVLLMRSCWIRVEVESDYTSHDEELRGLSGQAVGLALQPQTQSEEVELLEQVEVRRDVETDEPIFDVKIRRNFEHQKLVVEAVPCEDIKYQPDWRRTSIDGIRFLAEFRRQERGELLEQGISPSVVEDLPNSPVEVRNTSVNRWTTHVTHAGGHEYSTELVDTHICYLRVDMEGDGTAQLWRILFAGERVLHKEQRPFVPYVNGIAILRAFRVDGVSLDDRLKQIEDTKTGALRQWMDNLSNQNNSRAALVEGQVNLQDWINSRPNGYVRVKTPDAIQPIVVQDAGPSARSLLEYEDKERSERGGASLDLQTASAQIAGETMGGIERQYSSREKAAQMMAVTFAETLIRDLYRLVHRTMRTNFQSELDLKRNGEWQRTDPRQWSERQMLDIHAGRSQAEWSRRLAYLERVIGKIEQLIQAGYGGVLTDLSKYHNALVDWCEAAGLEAPEQYWIDPTSDPAMETAERRQGQQDAERAESEAQNAQLLRLSLGFERWKEQQANKRHTEDVRQKYILAAMDSEAKEAEIVGKATADLERAQLRAVSGGND